MSNKKRYDTKQKDIILNIIKNKQKEFTIKDIYDDVKDIVGLTTIYRLVDRLVSENKVNKYISKDNVTYYQFLEECKEENHFYLKCKKCGDLIHIDCDCIGDLFNHIFKEHGFRPNKDNIIIDGICKKCI